MSLDEIFTAILIQQPDNIERLWPFSSPIPCRFGICPNPCERENTYNLFFTDSSFSNHGQRLLTIQEKSHFIERCCCMAFLRPASFTGTDMFGNLILTADKGMFIFEPEIKVHYKGHFIGSILEPCSMSIVNCKFNEIKILDSNGTLILKILGSIFQVGTCCLCGHIKFPIYNSNDEQVGEIIHLCTSCRRECCTKEDNFGIQFPEFSTLEEKILIVFASILLDYLYFEGL